MTDLPQYAWCFSHGRLHTFWPGDEPWCTANWMPVDGASEDEATASKIAEYGEAQFLHELSGEQQMRVIQDGAR